MINILASDLTIEQIQNGIIIVDQDTKDYANNVIEWQVLGKNQDGANTITVQTKTLVGDGASGYGDSIGDRRYDPSRNILNSELQTWLDTTFYNHLGSDFRSKIIPVTKLITPYQSGDIASKECKLFNLSVSEIGGGTPTYCSSEPGAFTYQYYQSINSTVSSIKRVHSGGSNSFWWLRSPVTLYSDYVWYMRSDGGVGNNNVYVKSIGPAPACVLPNNIELELIDGETNKYNIIWNNSGSGNSDPSQDPDPSSIPTSDYDILASELTTQQIQSGIIIIDSETKDYADNTIEWQVLGKDQDGNGTITIQTKTLVGDGAEGYGDAIGDRRYDPSQNKLDSELQVWLDTDFYNHIGSNLKLAIIPTTKAITPYQSGDIASRECKLFNLSVAEVSGYDLSGSAPKYYTPESNAFTYQYYQGINSTSSNTKRIHNDGSDSYWWLRSPYTRYSSSVWFVYSDGDLGLGYDVSSTSLGPSPACVLPSSTKLKLIDGETNKYNIVWNNSGSGSNDPSQDPDPTPSPTPSDSNAKNFVSYENMYNILNNLNIGNNKITVDSTTETMIFN